jgi:hypothetical protein
MAFPVGGDAKQDGADANRPHAASIDEQFQ